MLIIRIAGALICTLAVVYLLKDGHKPFAALCVSALILAVIGAYLGSSLSDAVLLIKGAAEKTEFSGYSLTLLKAVGIAYIASVMSDICKSAGEGTLATAAEFAGKAELIVLAVPLAGKLLEIASELLI